jgi:AraC-like DNA-binding protein
MHISAKGMSISTEIEIIQQIDDELRFGDVEAGTTRVPHPEKSLWWVRDYDTVTLPLTTRMVIVAADEQRFEVPPGRAIAVAAGLRRRSEWPDGGVAEVHWFNMHLGLADGRRSVFAHFATPTVLSAAVTRKLVQVHTAMAAVSSRTGMPSLARSLRRKSLAADTLALVLPELNVSERQAAAMSRLQPLFSALSDSDHVLPVPEMAAICHLSVSRFHHLFREAVGMSPQRFFRQQRLEQAARMLTETDLPLAAIASDLAFADPFHFSRQFRQYHGISPSAYRQARQAAF